MPPFSRPAQPRGPRWAPRRPRAPSSEIPASAHPVDQLLEAEGVDGAERAGALQALRRPRGPAPQASIRPVKV